MLQKHFGTLWPPFVRSGSAGCPRCWVGVFQVWVSQIFMDLRSHNSDKPGEFMDLGLRVSAVRNEMEIAAAIRGRLWMACPCRCKAARD